MRVFKENDSIWVGLMIGATFPVLGFYLVEILFDFLTNQGLMDSVTSSSSGKRLRTLALMGICSNIIPIQLLNNRYILKTVKGVLIATFIYCGVWFFNFGQALLG